MLIIENLNKNFGKQNLFENTSFQINQREKIGLVGRNGHGKSTLLNILAGLEELEDGKIIIPKNYKIAYVKQELKFTKDNILEEVAQNLPPDCEDDIWKVEKILFGLGFNEDNLYQSPLIFSGGFQIRINLAKILISDANLLLLDEPNNYLDITSIRWLENFLVSWQKEFVLITHDRSFMDKVVTHIAGIHRKKITKIEGDTSKYYSRVNQDEEIYEKSRVNEEKKKKETELFISKFRAKARLAGLVQSRIKTLSKLETKTKLEKIEDLDFNFNYKECKAKNLLNAENISFSYDSQNSLISNFSLNIEAHDRICIIGKNGKGKTTLLKLLADELPLNEGKITINPQVVKAYYEQSNLRSLNEEQSIYEELLTCVPEDKQKARDMAAAMLFEKDDALKPIKVLSGGEKNRVMLGKILLSPSNLLLLDEPTNHLDLESCEALLDALENFPGAIVLVSHNELFLDKLAQKIILFQNNKIEVLNSTYQDFLSKIGWLDEEKNFNTKKSNNSNKKELKKQKANLLNEKAKTLNPIKEKIQKLEKEIELCDIEKEKIEKAIIKLSKEKKAIELKEKSKELHLIKKKSDEFLEELENALNLLDEKEEEFQQLKIDN